MDRSLLSNQDIVAASRDFVCIRLLTYESESEGKFLESIYRGRSGQLENSVFAILAPDGTKLTRAGRGPHMVFRGRGEAGVVENMLEGMRKIAADYPGKESEERALPQLEDLRRALNASSCDIQPLVVVADTDAEARAAKVEQVKKLAWSSKFVGIFSYVVVSDLAELAVIEGSKEAAGVYVVQPDSYGLKGTILARDAGTDAGSLSRALGVGQEKFVGVTKDSRKHIREGRQSGKNWDPEIPVTDPHSPEGERGPKERRGPNAENTRATL